MQQSRNVLSYYRAEPSGRSCLPSAEAVTSLVWSISVFALVMLSTAVPRDVRPLFATLAILLGLVALVMALISLVDRRRDRVCFIGLMILAGAWLVEVLWLLG